MAALARDCGECTACCKTHAILALEKPRGQWCPACAIGRGCTVYARRPAECREFQCLWLQGMGSDDDRPDRTKLVLDVTPDYTVRVSETTAGALATRRGRRMVETAVALGFPVLTFAADGGRTLCVGGPVGARERAVAAAAGVTEVRSYAHAG